MKTMNSKRVTKPITEEEKIRFSAVKDYMEKNLGTGLKALAEVAGLSPFHFHRRFSLYLGEPPHKRTAKLQVSAAKLEMVKGKTTGENP